MSAKWFALAIIVAGIGFIIAAWSTSIDGGGEAGLDRLPFTILMLLAGAMLILGGALYFAVRIFTAL